MQLDGPGSRAFGREEAKLAHHLAGAEVDAEFGYPEAAAEHDGHAIGRVALAEKNLAPREPPPGRRRA